MNKAVFIDRDGTINEEMGYINHISRFKIFDFVPEAIKLLNSLGFLVIIVTNQAGIARGYFPYELVDELHQFLKNKISEKGGKIDNIYICPHYKGGIIKEYSIECDCRKPKIGLIEKANIDYKLDLSKSYMIGDRFNDISFGKKAGLKTIMVKTGYGLGEIELWKKNFISFSNIEKPDFFAENLLEAAKIIEKEEKGEKL